jgi:signal transduction histidine kinase
MKLSMPIALPELLAHLPNGLVVLDAHGVVLAHNDAALYLLATRQRNWDGREFLDVIAGSPLEIDLRMLLTSPVESATRHLMYQRADGVRMVELQLSELHADDTQDGALLVVRERTERVQREQMREQRVAQLSALSRLARIANAAATPDALLCSIICELARLAPGVRVLFGLFQPDGTTLRLEPDDRLRAASARESHAPIEENTGWLHNLLRANYPYMISVADEWLARTTVQALLQRAGVRNVLVVPLSGAAAARGVMFAGYGDQRTIAPNDVQLFASVGELLAETLDRMWHADEAHEANRAKSMLLATVSHELRTPLGSMTGFIELLEDGVFGEVPARFREPLALLRYSGSVLMRLIDDLQDYSRLEGNYLTIDLEPVDLAMVVRDVVGAMQPQIQKRGLAVNVAIPPALPRVYANSARVAQVLTNLLANAIKFTERGTITVRAIVDGQQVRFSVKDTGIGIAPQQQHMLFREFRQIDNEHTRRYGGSGLGLAISQKLMHQMGGTLTFESTLGVGSTFSGALPILPARMRESAQRGATR